MKLVRENVYHGTTSTSTTSLLASSTESDVIIYAKLYYYYGVVEYFILYITEVICNTSVCNINIRY